MPVLSHFGLLTLATQSSRKASQYGNLLIVDPEEEFYAEEVAKVAADVSERGLGLIIFAEWYNVDIMAKMRFFDDNTRSWWTPITGDNAHRTLLCHGVDSPHVESRKNVAVCLRPCPRALLCI